MKKQIIVYGVYSLELRRKIESFLDDEFVIIGYTDSYHKKDILDNKTFIKRENLKNIDFDYIVISVNSVEACRQIKEQLCLEGIERDKIVIPHIFFEKNYIWQKDMISHIQNNLTEQIETIILGLSYSLRGIDTEQLLLKTFNYSWHGLDIYYNKELLKWSKRKGYLSYCKQAILVFPYYIFNHDMSCESYQYRMGQILSVRKLYDWHNGYNLKDEIVTECINGIKMFGAKFQEYYKARENIYDYNVIDPTQKMQLGHIWSQTHEKTIKANRKHFDELIYELKEITDRIIVIIPPYCRDVIDVNKETIERNKEVFYEAVSKHDIEIYDTMYKWKDKTEYFSDAMHLNYEGAKHFTEFINGII